MGVPGGYSLDMSDLKAFKNDIEKLSDRKKAKILSRFFKTGKGHYGEGDIFAGLMVPQSRHMALKYKSLSLANIKKLLGSKVHEERLIALLILVSAFAKASADKQQKIFKFYLSNAKFVNNWDLVDLSAPKIVGAYLSARPKTILNKLAGSKNLWERRIAMVATYQFIKEKQFAKTLEIAKVLLTDKHDLIHKAVGWMLREVGKRDEKTLTGFLDRYKHQMPRTALRYAIERFPENRRKAYLAK